MDILKELTSLADNNYKEFHQKLIPGVDRALILGVRVPKVRLLAKELSKSGEGAAFMAELPHHYYDENMLHALLLNELKKPDIIYSELTRFGPFIDNWAVCDALVLKPLAKEPERFWQYIKKALNKPELYVKRLAINMLMRHFLDAAFQKEQPELVANIATDEYYLNMSAAWYFATALAKQREIIWPYFAEKRLKEPVLKMAIRKCLESYRIKAEDKAELRKMRG